MKKFLIIQTAFIGDVILATPIIEKLHRFFPGSEIDFLLRKGNESLFDNHPFINRLLIWNKKEKKYLNLLKIISDIRSNRYDCVINVQRFSSTGIITIFSKGRTKIGFDKNPFSFLFSQTVQHVIDDKLKNIHETDRNLSLIEKITDKSKSPVRLYPSTEDFNYISQYGKHNYICIAPASVWFTKQFPKDKWIDFIQQIKSEYFIYLLGGENDFEYCNDIIKKLETEELKTVTKGIINLSGKLSFLQTAALMKNAAMNYVNDSAPLHLASAVNAPVTSIFCSTVPAFGFGPLSDRNYIVETDEKLDCRPCGLHGFRKCPEKHFKCALNIKTKQLLKTLNDNIKI